jgi:hypothetical protein
VKVEEGAVWVELPPAEVLDAALATERVCVRTPAASEGEPAPA